RITRNAPRRICWFELLELPVGRDCSLRYKSAELQRLRCTVFRNERRLSDRSATVQLVLPSITAAVAVRSIGLSSDQQLATRTRISQCGDTGLLLSHAT